MPVTKAEGGRYLIHMLQPGKAQQFKCQFVRAEALATIR